MRVKVVSYPHLLRIVELVTNEMKADPRHLSQGQLDAIDLAFSGMIVWVEKVLLDSEGPELVRFPTPKTKLHLVK